MVSNTNPRVLIVDDEQMICTLLLEILGEQGYICKTAENAEQALTILKDAFFNIVLLDIKMPGLSGMDILSSIHKQYRETSVIMLTAVNDISTAVEAIKNGASDYITKPFRVEEVRSRIKAVLENKKNYNKYYDNCVPDVEAELTNSSFQNMMNFLLNNIKNQIEPSETNFQIIIDRVVEMARQFGLPEEAIILWLNDNRNVALIRENQVN
jgi:DNA-binding response OmpR family regulator